jgi:hypothetical protein
MAVAFLRRVNGNPTVRSVGKEQRRWPLRGRTRWPSLQNGRPDYLVIFFATWRVMLLPSIELLPPWCGT